MRRYLRIVATICSWISATGQNLKAALNQARQKGLSGYDLIDALDFWYGRDTCPYKVPHKILDMLGKSDGKVKQDDWVKGGLPEEQFHYFDQDKDGLLNPHESYTWFLQRKPARTMNVSEVNDPPRGHLQRIGSWKDPLPNEHLIYHKPYPHPRDFWRRHMDGYLPAVFKGAQHGWPCMNWTREVLIDKFGWIDAKLEPKVEARGNDSAYEDLDRIAPKHRLSLKEYFAKEEGKNMYVVSIIPQVMSWEVAHPSSLLCGSRKVMLDKRSPPPYKTTKHQYPHESGYPWLTHIFEANLWAASGRTRSQFHYDKEWNVNCLISGKKRWFFLNNFDYDDDLQWARGRKFNRENPLNNAWTDWVFLEPDKVDLIVQNKLRNMDYYELIQEAGDCIFIPYAMLHQVEKLDEGIQVAASWMFLPETIYDEESCEAAPLDEDLPLGAMDVLYAYTGKGIIPQGYKDPLNMVQEVSAQMRKKKENHLTLKRLAKAVSRGASELRGQKTRIKKIFDMLNKYAKDPEKGLTREELYKVPLRLWCKPAAEGDDEGPLQCDHGEEFEVCDDSEFEKMDNYLKDRLSKVDKTKDRGGEKGPPLTHSRIPESRIPSKKNKAGRPRRGEEL